MRFARTWRVRLEVQRGEGIVKDVESRLLGKGTRDGNALLLPTGKAATGLGDLRFEAIGLFHDEVIRRCLARSFGDLLITGIRVAIANVVGDRSREQRGLLRGIGYERAQLCLWDAHNVDAVEQDAAVRGIVETLDEIDEHALSRSRRPNERIGLARLELKADAIERGLFGPLETEADHPRSARNAHERMWEPP